MKLYYSKTLNPRKACAVARYLALPVDYVRIDLARGEHKTPQFLAMNPKRQGAGAAGRGMGALGSQRDHVPSVGPRRRRPVAA